LKYDRRSDDSNNLRVLKKAIHQGRSSEADPRFTFHASRFTVFGSDARTMLADFFSILLEAWSRKEQAAPIVRVRRFGSMTSRGLLPNTSAKRRGRLCLLAFPFDGGIVHDSATLNTAHLARFVLHLRDTIGDHATVGTGAWPIHWRELWMDI
jgi:hypothetical protein